MMLVPCHDNDEEYTNLYLSASCSFYSYTLHFPSPSPCLPYLAIPLSRQQEVNGFYDENGEFWDLDIGMHLLPIS